MKLLFPVQPQLPSERLPTAILCQERTPARHTEIASTALAIEDKPFLPVIPSQRHNQIYQICWSSQLS